jgi:RNA polymerase sigma factor (TIGR02999 family)
MNDVNHILIAIEQGDPQQADQLLPLVYGELRKLAAHKLAREAPGQTIDATGLVHEAYLRLVGVNKSLNWDSRGHFFAAAAEAMRRILVERARRRHALKRGGRASRLNLDDSALVAPAPSEDIVALSDALDALALQDPLAASLVKLRFFAGLNMGEASQALDISVRSAQDVWAFARAWLYRKMQL